MSLKQHFLEQGLKKYCIEISKTLINKSLTKNLAPDGPQKRYLTKSLLKRIF